jgi:ubiquinone/menaquinone biosynthesis C-methylase UbiE
MPKQSQKPEFIARQGRQPTGLLGHIVARVMAKETLQENNISLDHLALEPTDDLIEIGFGHGATLARAAQQITHGRLAGADFSEVMVQLATQRNRALIATGRMKLAAVDSEHLPFADGSFNKALCVHTIYFWRDPGAHLRELARVMRPGGRLVLTFRPHEDAKALATFPASVYTFPAIEEAKAIVAASGFHRLSTKVLPFRGGLMTWIIAERQ